MGIYKLGVMENKIKRINGLDTEKLIDIVKNYRQYGFEETVRENALQILAERGVTEEYLKLTGNFENETYSHAKEAYEHFVLNSRITFIVYVTLLVSNILVRYFYISHEILSLLCWGVSWLSFLLYFVFLIRSFLSHTAFYKAIDKKYTSEIILIYLLLGMPFYLIIYFYYNSEMEEQMKMIE